jgi:hypothetical protein
MLAPTPRERLVDAHGRPYFLWDVDMTLDEFERALQDETSICSGAIATGSATCRTS